MSQLIVVNNQPWLDICCDYKVFLAASCRLLGTLTTVSRLDYKPDVFRFKLNCETVKEVLDYPSNDDSFEDICNKSALKILEWAKDKNCRVRVMWSGGIDSTLALASILKTWPETELERIDVVLSSTSIDEYRAFYFRYIQNKFKTINAVTNHYDTYFHNGALVVTGELGDQLFGSDIVTKVLIATGSIEDIKTKKNYQDLIISAFTKRLGPENGKAFFEHYAPIVAESPVPIRSAIDFLWWWNFSQKWQNVKYRELCNSSPAKIHYNSKSLIHFYDSIEFQRWAIDNQESGIKMPGDLKTYKQPAKDIIVKFTGDDSYLTKKKYGSQAKISYFRESAKRYMAVTRYLNFTNSVQKYTMPGFRYMA